MNGEEKLPFVTFAIPTYNSGSKLERLLKSITKQNYPKSKYEILIADGGSTDNTLEIAKKYNCKILYNPKRFAEPGKALCVDHAKGEMICFVDDDNELPTRDWLLRMIKPLIQDKEIVASEPIKFEYSKNMSPLDRYWALSGFNDPVFYYMGLYDKLNYVSGSWNGVGIKGEDKGDYIKFTIESTSKLITIGANGFIVRTEIIRKVDYHNLLDIDKVAEMIRLGYNTFAKVKIGIYHYFCPDLNNYVKKAKRKIKNVRNPNHVGVKKRKIEYPKLGVLKFILATLTLLPLFYYSFRGYLRKKDNAWFMHIPVCWVTLLIYGHGFITTKGVKL